MSKLQKWLLYEAFSIVAILTATFIVPNMPWWKYFILGICFVVHGAAMMGQQDLRNND